MVEEVRELHSVHATEIVDCDAIDSVGHRGIGDGSREFRLGGERAKEQDVVGVDHGGIGLFLVGNPRRAAAVEILKRLLTRRHIPKTANPDEAVRVVDIAESANDMGTNSFLWLDEVFLEERNQVLALSSINCVLA